MSSYATARRCGCDRRPAPTRLPPASIGVTVKDGVVTLSGEIETRTDAEMLPKFMRKVTGVVAVESTLTWRFDGPIQFDQRRN